MAELNKMYKGVVNSPSTYLQEPLASGGSIIYVIDGSALGELPNLAVIGNDQTAETVLVKNVRSDGGYDVDRAVEGNAKDWPQMTTVARNFTNYDYDKLIKNIEKLNTEKVEKVEGKGLSTNDFTDIRKDKVDNIPSNPKYTDTTYNVATTSSSGLMSSADKTKLNGVEAGAQKNIMTSADKVKLDKFTEVEGKPYYNGEEIGGAVPNLTLNELTLGGRFKIVYNDIEDSLDIEVI